MASYLSIMAATNKGEFTLMLRLYWPYEPPYMSILDGTWKSLAVKQVK